MKTDIKSLCDQVRQTNDEIHVNNAWTFEIWRIASTDEHCMEHEDPNGI